MATAPNPLNIDRFTVHIDNEGTGQFVIADRDMTPISAATATAVLGDRAPVIVWEQSDRYGWLVFPVTDEGDRLAMLLCDQLNDADAENDVAGLIDSAAGLAERIEAEAPDAPDVARAKRGLAAYQRAAALEPHTAPGIEPFRVGERVTLGGTDGWHDYEHGIMCALGVAYMHQFKPATVVLPYTHTSPLIVIMDDSDDILALPNALMYVRRAQA
jgi:hypothetical protein